MKLRNWDAVVLGGLTVFASQLGFADTSPPPAAAAPPATVPTVTTPAPAVSTTTAEKTLFDKIGEKAALSYFGIYRGGSLSGLGNTLQPDVNGNLDPTSPQSFENYVTAGYRFNKDLMLGVSTHFFYFPVGAPDANPAGPNQTLQMWDPSIVLARSNLIDQGGFKLTGKLYVQLPLTSSDILQRQHLATAITPTFIGNYDVPKTDLTVGFYAYVAAYIPAADAIDTARTYKIYVAPTANYQITKTVAATLWVDLFQITRNRGTGFISGMSNYTMDIEPGIAWDITKNITINPILNIYPSAMTMAATSLQAMIIAKAF